MFKSILPQGSCWQKSALMLTLLLGFASLALGQTDKARLSGTVKDSNGGVIPGASVVVKNDRTGAERTATTNEQGEFSFTVLEPSVYTVTVTAKTLLLQNCKTF